MSDIDRQCDKPVEAIAKLAYLAVIADLGPDVLKKLLRDPRDLFNIAAADLPALIVYRASDKRYMRNSMTWAWDIHVAFEYSLPNSSFEERRLRFDTLQAVWASIAKAVLAGKHKDVSGGAAVLLDAGIWSDKHQASARYEMTEGGRDNYPDERKRFPMFIGEIPMTYDEPPDATFSSLDDFLHHHTDYDIADGEPVDAEDETELPPTGS